MKQITETEVEKRLSFDNPWWQGDLRMTDEVGLLPKRAYFRAFINLVSVTTVRRAVVLMGPRRAGKTVMLRQAVDHLIRVGIGPQSILYVSLDTPTYVGSTLERLLALFVNKHNHSRGSRLFVFFDEVQYYANWKVHLKSLVDSFPAIRFVASGSAAAALRLKSQESGAGRFTDFLLPPLTFAEYLDFVKSRDAGPGAVSGLDDRQGGYPAEVLNHHFIDYLNFGGFPEAVFGEDIRRDFRRFVGSDILDKVLLKDLPSLYGVADTRELNRLFATIAYNTGDEVNLEALSQESGIAKNTLRKYIDYLEAAFLVQRIHRLDQNARRFKRVVAFKIYLTNPCLRAALFGPVEQTDEAMGNLAETALVSQFLHGIEPNRLFYARWNKGEVDLVILSPATQKPFGAIEVKWSDRPLEHPEELRGFREFISRHRGLTYAHIYTQSREGMIYLDGTRIPCLPLAPRCEFIGRFSMHASMDRLLASLQAEELEAIP